MDLYIWGFVFLLKFIQSRETKKIPHIFDQQKYEIKSCLSPELQEHEKSSCKFYGLMIDAGSTGTRLHAFEFSHVPESRCPFKLEREIFHEEKPGLSAFVNQPSRAGDIIRKLMTVALNTVPRNQQEHSPLALKATAGLRLLPDKQAQAILDEVELVFKRSPFLVNEDSVQIMDGTDEGIFGWFTLNFLLNKLDPDFMEDKNKGSHTAAALDLGGASTQVTFLPTVSQTLLTSPKDHLKNIRIFGTGITLFTHSYLGNGLVASRLGTLELFSPADSKNNLQLNTSCLPQDYTLNWEYSAKFVVKGSPDYSPEECLDEARSYCNHPI